MTDLTPENASDSTPTTDPKVDLDSTLNLLQQAQQDFKSASPAVAVALIERWEEHLQGTEIFDSLSELRQALLEGHNTEIARMLKELSDQIAAYVEQMPEQDLADLAPQVEQASKLLSQVSQRVPQ